MKISLKYKAKVYEIEVNEEETIEVLKKKLEELTIDEYKITSKDMKFIASGKILKDEQTLKEANIHDKSQIFVSGTSIKPSQKEAPLAGIDTNNNYDQNHNPNYNQNYNQPPFQPNYNNNQGLGSVDNTMLQNLMNQQIDQIQNDPAALDRQLEPFLRGMPENDRQKWKDAFLENMRAMKENPELMKTALDQVSQIDPKTLQSMIGGNGLQQPNFGNMQQPPSFNNMPNINNPYQNAQYPLPSPTIPCSHGFYPYGHQFQTPPPTQSQPIDFENVYKQQLLTLEGMDFKNRDLNLKALIRAKGDINLAIEFIFEWQTK